MSLLSNLFKNFIKMDKEVASQSAPEDIKRYIVREIQKFKTNNHSIHYQFAQNIVTRHEALMDLFVASESTKSEIEELERAYAFYSDMIKDERNEIAICTACKKIMGVFKNTFQDVSKGAFVQHLLGVIDGCPYCGMKGGFAIVGTGFLTSPISLEKAMGAPPPPEDKEAGTLELLWITLRMMNDDLKTSIKTMGVMTAIKGNPSLKDLLKEGRIQNLIMQNKEDGASWTLFGKLTAGDIKKYGLEELEAKTINDQGEAYRQGKGVNQDYVKALEYFRKAADMGYSMAQFNLGNMYAAGQGILQNNSEAMKWFQRAAEQGLVEAQYNLGVMYNNGLGVPRNDSEAAKWYQKAAEQGYPSAQYNLGWMYENGVGVPQSNTEALEWYRKAAEQSYARAQFNLGNIYYKGRGVPRNDSEAAKWYQKAAEQGHADAQNNIGIMYQNGHGVPKSDTEAVKWYRLAADQGNAHAQYNLGWMYANGFGITQSNAEAVKWYHLAADQGHLQAKHELDAM